MTTFFSVPGVLAPGIGGVGVGRLDILRMPLCSLNYIIIVNYRKSWAALVG